MKKRVLAMFLAAMMVVSLAGCGEKEEPAVPAAEPETIEEPEPVPEPEPQPEPEVYVPAGTNPLTGLPIEPEYESNRPVAVMFNNLKAAQPQLGISQADIIYEVPAEGGITRMLGVFQSLEGVGTLGSIRSSRPYYLELALGHDALYVHAGGSPEAYQDIPAWDVDNMDGVNGGSDAQIFWRDAERRKTMDYEHTLVTSGEKIQAYVEAHFRTDHKEGYTYTQAFAEDGTPAGGEAAEQISVKFSNYKTGTFAYDAAAGAYLASQYGGPYTDGGTGAQVSATNVLVLKTTTKVLDSVGRLSVNLIGGEGTYFCGGKAVPIQWSKADRNSQFVYKLTDGTLLTLGKGTSYVCIIDAKNGVLTYQ